MMKKEFKVYSPLTAKSVKEFTTKEDSNSGDSDRILLEGIASTTSRDLHDEIVSSEAIDSMAEQALALNIHSSHWYGIEDVIGAIKDADVEDKKLHIKFLITKKYTPDIKDLLDTGVKLGLSIGGYVTNYDEKNRIINEIELHEISLTPMPANWDTFGTVTTSKGLVESNCLSGACYAIVKTLDNGDKNMDVKNDETIKEEESSGLTQDDVIQLINEYMAEKEETIAQEITDKVESQLESIVEAKIAEALDDESSEEEEGETKATEDEEDDTQEDETTEEEEDEEDKTKSNDPTVDVAQLIADSVDKALGDEFVDKVAERMFGNLDKNRGNGSKFKQYQESIADEPVDEEPVEKSTYSTQETAEILMRKQRAANPIMAAALKNLQ